MNLTQKAKDLKIQSFAIKGTRWFQKSYGSTYHRAYLSALIDGVWVELGSTVQQYGYDEQYVVSGKDWLLENGYITDVESNDLIEYYAVDVKRERDL